MTKLAIKGHATRGSEVIELLEMLGGKNENEYVGDSVSFSYFIDNGEIDLNTNVFENAFTLEEFLEKFPYKVGDKVIIKGLPDYPKEIKYMMWDNQVLYSENKETWFSVDALRIYNEQKEENMKEKKTIQVYKAEVISFTDAQNKEYELDLCDKFEIVLKDGKYYAVQKQPKYPKTYEECIGKLPINWDGKVQGYKSELLTNFQKLLICRDVYWKVAGEQMGLGKSWKPDYIEESYEQGCPVKYVIYYTGTYITKGQKCTPSHILAFPTEEMCDAFYESEEISKLIEECKELL